MKLEDIKGLNKEKILSWVGLQVASSATAKILSMAALLGLGVLVGASAAVLLTPRTGKQLRNDIRRRLRNGSDHMADLLPDSTEAQASGA